MIKLGNSKEKNWHLGKCINEGVRQSSGDILVIPDGDVIVEKDFLQHVQRECDQDNLVTYFLNNENGGLVTKITKYIYRSKHFFITKNPSHLK